jgi:hypothetical protein
MTGARDRMKLCQYISQTTMSPCNVKTEFVPRRVQIEISGVLAGTKWNRGCLIGDLSLETTAQSKLLRGRLEAIFQEWRAPFAACIAEAQTPSEIDSTFDPMDLAEFLLASWEGAILRIQLASGIHYLQEDHPDVIGANVKEWLIELGVGSSPKQKLTFVGCATRKLAPTGLEARPDSRCRSLPMRWRTCTAAPRSSAQGRHTGVICRPPTPPSTGTLSVVHPSHCSGAGWPVCHMK